MLDTDNPTGTPDESGADTAGPTGAEAAAPPEATDSAETAPVRKAAKKAAKKTTKKASAGTAKKTATKRTTAKAAAEAADPLVEGAPQETQSSSGHAEPAGEKEPAKKPLKKAAKKATRKSTTGRGKAAATAPVDAEQSPADQPAELPVDQAADQAADQGSAAEPTPAAATSLLFKAPEPTAAPRRRRKAAPKPDPEAAGDQAEETPPADGRGRSGPSDDQKQASDKASDRASDKDAGAAQEESADSTGDDEGEETGGRRRRRRGGRRRRKSGGDDNGDNGQPDDRPGRSDSGDKGKRTSDGSGPADAGDDEDGSASRRRRRRRRSGEQSDGSGDDPDNTVTKVRKPRSAEDEITAVTGSTRLEAKKQRRREGREAGRRRAPVVSEAEFLARREAVDRTMVIRQRDDLTQIAVLEDKVLVEHYVARESQKSMIGDVYLGRVQNVLPSMEAAFVDIGQGRNAVLYAGEVNWSALGHKNGQPRKVESVLKSGQPILVQVTKDPVGHKGARLTSQISLPGRFLVYVPDGTTSGISRKLPDTERTRLKTLLKEIVPDTAGVIVRTAAEGASEDELTRDVQRLTARWEDISAKVEKGNAPQLLYGEPDLTLKVVRDLFTEDFDKLVVSGDEAWDLVHDYVTHVAPDLKERLERYDDSDRDVFTEYRLDEQIAKALDRKVWLPSGGSLVIDRTEAMTVVDVNTGKFTGSGGNLEETVTKNNLEAAEEIVRQLRLRDIGGIIVVDFIDMVLESNRDLVLRRMVECLGRDRTRHQVAEVTSLGLVQMTRKRIGTGLLEAFSEPCEHCDGRGLHVHGEPVESRKRGDDESRRNRRGGRNRGKGGDSSGSGETPKSPAAPSPAAVAAIAKPENADKPALDEREAEPQSEPPSEPAQREEAEQPESVPGPADGSSGEQRAKQPSVKKQTRARRPAGPPAGSTAGSDGVVVVAPSQTDASGSTAPAETGAPDTDSGAEAPKVTAVVRRRVGARRAAGPPAGGADASPDHQGEGRAAVTADAPVQSSDDGTQEQLRDDDSVSAGPVPARRRGTRKR